MQNCMDSVKTHVSIYIYIYICLVERCRRSSLLPRWPLSQRDDQYSVIRFFLREIVLKQSISDQHYTACVGRLRGSAWPDQSCRAIAEITDDVITIEIRYIVIVTKTMIELNVRSNVTALLAELRHELT